MCYTSAYFWREEEFKAFNRTFQSQSSDEENGEHQVGQSGGDVHSLNKRGAVSRTAHTHAR